MATTVPKDALRTLVAALAGLPVAVVIWDGEPVPPVVGVQDGRRIVLNVAARRSLGRDEAQRSYPDDATIRISYRGQRVLTVSMRAENYGIEEGFDLLESVRTQLDQADIGVILNASDLSFNSSGDVRTLPGVARNRAISVAQLDVLLNQTVTRVVDKVVEGGDWIASVEVTGEDELAGAGTDLIEAP